MWKQLKTFRKLIDATSRFECLYHIGRVSLFAMFVTIVGFGAATNDAMAEQELVVVAFGDSLTAGYGLPATDVFPVRLETHLRQADLRVRVLNSGISGDTTAGGRARLDWVLWDDPDAVIVEFGANDALRGIDPTEAARNLNEMLEKLKQKGIRVLLAGMLAPPNLGERYTKAFNSIYPDLAAAHDVMLYPFFLDGVAAQPHLNQLDGIHPNAKGVAIIVERISPYVKRLLAPE